MIMKKIITLIFICAAIIFTYSCNVLKRPKEGCPSNGKNVGAEKLLSGEKVPKVRRFRD
jgi:hypothetical protein